jgi:hypothetical protein
MHIWFWQTLLIDKAHTACSHCLCILPSTSFSNLVEEGENHGAAGLVIVDTA